MSKPSSTRPKKSRDLAPLLLLSLCLLVYGNTLWNQLVYEDRQLTTENMEFQSGIYLGELLHRGYFFYAQEQTYRPVVTASYLLDYALWGEHPAGYHLSNLLFHFLATWGLYVFLHLLFGRRWVALAAAVLFALHPVSAEAVCGVAYRADLLAAGFGFWALAAYVRGRRLVLGAESGEAKEPAHSGRWIVLSLTAFLLALFSKMSAIGLPLLAFLLEVACRTLPRKFRRAIGPLIGLAVVASFYGLVRFHLLVSPEEIPGRFLGWSRVESLLSGLVILFTYIRLLLLPVHLSVGWTAVSITSLFQSVALLGLVIWVCLLAAVIWTRRKAPAYFVAGSLFVLGFLPVVGLWPLEEAVAERYLYLPLAGFCLGVALLIERKVPQSLRVLVLVVLAFCCGARTLARTFDWRDELTLWRSAAEVSPDSAVVRSRLAVALWRMGLRNDAEGTFLAALKTDPEEFEAHYWCGLFCLEQGEDGLARGHLKRAVDLRPNDSQALLAFGRTLEALDKPLEAEKQYVRMLEINPDDYHAFYRLAVLNHKRGSITVAEIHCREVLRIRPDHRPSLSLLARLYGEGRHYAEAAQILEQVVAMDPGAADLLYNLAYSYRQLGERAKAREAFQQLVELEPDNAKVWLEKADNERQYGDLEQALSDARRALELQPGYEEAERFLEMVTPAKAPGDIPSSTSEPSSS